MSQEPTKAIYSTAVGLRTSQVLALEEKRELPRALMGGTRTMRAAAEKFLPRHKAEKADVYEARLLQTFLFNAFKTTLTRMVGKMFEKPVTLSSGSNAQIAAFCDDVDGRGRGITPFAMDMAVAAMRDGVVYVLVDYPVLEAEEGTPAEAKEEGGAVKRIVTMADQIASNARPYWVMITANQLLGWRSESDNGAHQLTQFRYEECSVEEDGDYGEKVVERVRVLFPGAFELWEREAVNDAGKTEYKYRLVKDGVTNRKDIPIVPFYTNCVGFMAGEPPLTDLAELNQEHWISSSENRRALMFSRFAMLLFKGFRETELANVEVGPDKGIPCPENGDVSYIEHTGKGIESGFADLDRIEKRMTSAGMTTRVENAGSVAATTSAINSAESNAALKSIAKELSGALTRALQITGEYLSVPTSSEALVYDEFATVAAATVDELLKLWTANGMSRETLWDILSQRGILPDNFDAEAEAVRIEKEVGESMDRMRETTGGAFGGMQSAPKGSPTPKTNRDANAE